MCPDVLQFLTYMAGRSQRLQLGSMVVVLPWHDALRVAEQVSMLDNISNGRMVLGLGRGLGRVEFDGFRVPMEESRRRFVESAEMILRGLEQGYCEYDGEFIKQPRRDLRPAPFKTFKGRTYAAAVSPESVRIMAELGVGILIIPQKPWEIVAAELSEYRTIYREVNDGEAPPTIAAGWTFCDRDAGRAREMAERYIGGYWHSVIKHYEFQDEHLMRTKGYEYYGKMQEMIGKYGASGVTDFFLNLQIWGTPEQCLEKIQTIRGQVNCNSYIGVFSYAGMPIEEAERSMRLFAAEVLPELKKW
ncbi:MAG: LLM class flavin-dependent oxidoreductase [Deltaproteobacteria bacterium]|nr:LLM class flavin-dependent oxidoreductase [Deltaproteobacteria bacterium]